MKARQEPTGPRTQDHWVDDKGRDWGVEIHWDLLEGRYEPVSVEFCSRGRRKRPVTHEVIKRFPLGSTIRHARRKHAELELEAITWPELAGQEQRLRDEALRFGAHRGVPLTPEDLQGIAAVYRSAWDERRPVTEAVAAAVGVSKSTAGKRIMAARRAGYLEGVGGKS